MGIPMAADVNALRICWKSNVTGIFRHKQDSTTQAQAYNSWLAGDLSKVRLNVIDGEVNALRFLALQISRTVIRPLCHSHRIVVHKMWGQPLMQAPLGQQLHAT